MALRENVFSVLNLGEIHASLCILLVLPIPLLPHCCVTCPLLCHQDINLTEHLSCVPHRSTFLPLRNGPSLLRQTSMAVMPPHATGLQLIPSIPIALSQPSDQAKVTDCLMHTATACPHRNPNDVFCSWCYRSVSAACSPLCAQAGIQGKVPSMPLCRLPSTFTDHFWVCLC